MRLFQGKGPNWTAEMGRLNAEKTRHITTISFGAAMVRAALFVLLLPCASALQLPSHGRPRLVPLSHSSSSRGGGLSVRSGPIICKTTDEDWARRWPNATPEELANMKKWCAAGPSRAQRVIHTLRRCTAAPLHGCAAAPRAPLRHLHHCCTRARARQLLLMFSQGRGYSARPTVCALHIHDMHTCLQSTLGLTLAP